MTSIGKLKDRARKHEQREDWRAAIEAYQKVLAAEEGRDDIEPELGLYNRVGDLFLRLGQTDQAVSYYEQAADRYGEAGFFNNAIALCNKALRHRPNRAEIYLKLSRLCIQQGFIPDARRWILDYAERQVKAGHLEDALEGLSDFADTTGDPDVRELLARHLANHDRRDEAVSELRQAHAAFVDQGDEESARRVAGRARELEPGVDLAEPGAGEEEVFDFASGVRESDAAGLEEDEGLAVETHRHDDDLSADAGTLEGFEGTSLDDDAEAGEAGFEDFDEDDGDLEPLPLLDTGYEDVPDPGDHDAEDIEDVHEPGPALPGFDDPEPAVADVEEPELEEPPFDAPEPAAGFAEPDVEGAGPEEPAEQPADGAFEAPFEAPIDERADERADEPLEELAGEPEPLELAGPDEALGLGGEPEPRAPLDIGDLPEGAERREPRLGDEDPLEAARRYGIEPVDLDTTELSFGSDSAGATGEETDIDAEAVLGRARELVARALTDEALRELRILSGSGSGPDTFRQALGVTNEIVRHDANNIGALQARVEFASGTLDDELLVGAYLDLGDALARLGSETKARAMYERVLDLDPDNESARDALGGDGEGEDPIDLDAILREIEPAAGESGGEPLSRDPELESMLSHLRSRVGDQGDGGDAGDHYDLGLAFKEMGLIDEAIAEFQTALMAGEERLKVYEELGQCFVLKRQYTVAVKVFRRALQVPHEDERELLGVYYLLGQCHEELGQRDEAREAYARVLAIDESFEDVSARVARL